MRSFARIMVFGGIFLFLLAAVSQTGQLTKADQVADVLAMGTSLLVALTGLVFLLVTREGLPVGDATATPARGRR